MLALGGSTLYLAGASAAADSPPIPAPPIPAPPIPTPPAVKPPANQTPPTIAGTPQQGQSLTEERGTWPPGYQKIAIQWLRCDSGGRCRAISGQTAPSYTLTSLDVGSRIEVRETATYPGSAPQATSAKTGVVTPLPAPAPPVASTTGLLAVPPGTVTNQATTLVATITSSSGSTPPAGTVTFVNAGAPIGGCASVPVTTSAPSVNVTCQAAFSAAMSPPQLTAVFTPGAGSGLSGSSSPAVSLSVGRDSTSAALSVSSPTVGIGTRATYTATVAAKDLGAYQPSGSVQFLDNGKPIATCASLPLKHTQAATSAQCRIGYSRVARHVITAKYLGDAGFLGSISSAARVSAIRLRIIASKTNWVFQYTPTYAKILSLVVHQAPAGMTIVLNCHGAGCPFAAWSTAVASPTRCQRTKSRRCSAPKSRTVDLSSRFRGHRLHPGTVVTVKLTRTLWIGKEYVFSTRAARAPRVKILCVVPGARRPGVGCALH
jgi:hypothetical protein